jgi:hypothetical protein
MRDSYVADVGDFGKYALLNALGCCNPFVCRILACVREEWGDRLGTGGLPWTLLRPTDT